MAKRRKFSPIERSYISQRAGGCCEYCLSRHDFSPETFEVEHIISIFHDGANDLGNLAFSCGGCNGRKGYRITGIDPSTSVIVDLYNPRIDNWGDHFIWRDNFLIIEGITEKGRTTVELLKLNRMGVVNLRSALILIGIHPPLGQ